MKRTMFVSAVAVCLFMFGCSSTNSLNYQRSLARGTGDLSSTAVLASGKVSKDKILDAVQKVDIYLDGANLPDTITRDELIVLIKEQIPVEQLKTLADKLVVLIPADMNVKDGITVIRAFIKGINTGTTEFVEASN